MRPSFPPVDAERLFPPDHVDSTSRRSEARWEAPEHCDCYTERSAMLAALLARVLVLVALVATALARDFYQVLGVDRQCSDKDLKRACELMDWLRGLSSRAR